MSETINLKMYQNSHQKDTAPRIAYIIRCQTGLTDGMRSDSRKLNASVDSFLEAIMFSDINVAYECEQ